MTVGLDPAPGYLNKLGALESDAILARRDQRWGKPLP
jgi:hypothetical protein